MSGSELWKVRKAFGVEAVAPVLGTDRQSRELVSEAEIEAIARRSTMPYWTDGVWVWSDDPTAGKPAARAITAYEAWRLFDVDTLEDAQEKGSSRLGIAP